VRGQPAAGTRRAPRADVVEGLAGFLARLHVQQAVEVRLVVMPAPPDSEGRRQQAFLYVVADRPARHAAEVCQFVDAETALLAVHVP
jgi:hypothetical protein